MSKLLISEEPLQVLPALATIIGLNEALVLQQIHYWLEKSKIIVNNKKWVYNTFEEWHKQFPFWSLRTLKNVFKSLQNQKLIIAKQLSNDKFNKTNYYTINYDLLSQIDEKITTEKNKEIKEKSFDFLEDNLLDLGKNNSEFYDSAKVAQSTNNNKRIDSAKVAQSRQCKRFTSDSAKVAQSYIVKSFDKDYLTETTTEKLSPLPSLTKKQIKPEREDEREDKKDFFKFIETTREKYKGSGINNFYPTLCIYNSKEIKVASNKFLYFAGSTDYLSASQANEVWEYLFKNPKALISITKQGAAS